jgi:hypothetical protein
MLDIQHHIIARLKQQPKQGMPPKAPKKEELGGFKAGLDAATDSINMLANSNAILLSKNTIEGGDLKVEYGLANIHNGSP